MTTDDILRTVTEIAVTETGLPATDLTPDADLRAMAGVDSVPERDSDNSVSGCHRRKSDILLIVL
ncbi:hypothetical protein [Nocardia sp. NPDC004722]